MAKADEHIRVAITGGKGLLGTTLLRILPASVAIESDIRDAEALQEEMRAICPLWVIHAAAKTDVAACERESQEAHAVNVGGTEHAVRAARLCGARVVYISTVSVFNGVTGDYREEDRPEPINVYNATKREGELAVLAYDKGIVLRLNLIGVHPDGSRGKNFMEWLIDSVRANRDMTLFNDQLINPLSNWTVAEHIKTIIEKEIQETILHIGSSDRLSKAAVGKLVLGRFPTYRGTVTEKSVKSIIDGVIRPKQMWLNTNRAAALIGPMPTIERELDTIFRHPPFPREAIFDHVPEL